MTTQTASLTVCEKGGKHEYRRTYEGARFDVLRCRRCGLLITERDGGVRV